jgi:predicted kinase
LFVLSGLSGSGKSTVAGEIARKLDGIRIRSDAVRKHIALVDLDEKGPPALYTPEMSRATFERLEGLASLLLPSGCTVILDARYDSPTRREPLLALARAFGVPFRIVHCHAPLPVLVERIESRSDISDATVEVLRDQIERSVPFTLSEQPYLISIDTTRPDWQEELETRLNGERIP